MNFLNKLFSFFQESDEKKEKRKIKKIATQLSKLNPPVFNPRSRSLSPVFIQFIFDSFKPYLPFLRTMNDVFVTLGGKPYSRFLVNKNLTETQVSIIDSLDELNIKNKVATCDKKSCYSQVEDSLKKYMSGFSQETRILMNKNYYNMFVFSKLCEIDLDRFFKEFDHSYDKESFSYLPKFRSIEGKIFLNDFKLMVNILNSLDFNNKFYDSIFLYSQLKGLNLPDEKLIKESFKKINFLKNKNVFEGLVQVLSENLDFFSEPITKEINVIKDDMGSLVQSIKEMVEKGYSQKKIGEIDALKEKLFGGVNYPPLKNYIEDQNIFFIKNSLDSFMYTGVMDILKGFLIEKYGRSMKDLVNALIVKGRFVDAELQKNISNVYHKLEESLPKVLAFDKEVGVEGETGSRLNRIKKGVGKDKHSDLLMNEIIERINDDAKKISFDLITLFKNLYSVVSAILESFENDEKKIMVNLKTYDGNNTIPSLKKMLVHKNDLLLLMKIIKMYI